MELGIAFRLFVAVFCIVMPSLLFVGFVRLLDRLRDDDLVNRVVARMDESSGGGAPGPAAVLTGGAVSGASEPSMSACSNCGVPNPGFAGYCGNCLGKIES